MNFLIQLSWDNTKYIITNLEAASVSCLLCNPKLDLIQNDAFFFDQIFLSDKCPHLLDFFPLVWC